MIGPLMVTTRGMKSMSSNTMSDERDIKELVHGAVVWPP